MRGDMREDQKTLVIWRRLGKKHGEGQGFKKKSNEVIDHHLSKKAQFCKQCPENDWRWWQLNEELIVERPFTGVGFAPDTLIYYMPIRKWALIEHISFPELDPKWYWYVHIADFQFFNQYSAWVMTDLFVDVVLEKNGIVHSVLDLNELALAKEIGIINTPQLKMALESCQALLNIIQKVSFPPSEIEECIRFSKSKGWR
jgi:hypothetical protein